MNSMTTVSKNGRGPAFGIEGGAKPILTGLRPIFEANPHAPVKVSSKHLNFYYGAQQVLYGINLDMREKQVTAMCVTLDSDSEWLDQRMLTRIDSSHIEAVEVLP